MKEWIVTNGLGGYASLTHNNTNTRKFHGLLIASLNPPTERWVFVSNINDKIKIKDKTYELNDYKVDFNFDLFPTFSYDLNGVKIKKTYFMEYGKNTTIIKYEIDTKIPIFCTHTPIVNSRHFYDVTSQRYLNFQQDAFEYNVYIKPENTNKSLKIILQDSSYESDFYWEEFYYEKDRQRNDSWIDNNARIGKFQKDVKRSTEYYIVFTIEDDLDVNPSKTYLKEIKRKKGLIHQTGLPKRFKKFVLSTDNFLVKKKDKKSIIAGYHWFGDWGRDTLISLPGIALVTKRFDDAKQILFSFSQFSKNGQIPNAFIDKSSEAVYNTVDASLWYIDRVFQYLKYTNDRGFLEAVWPTLESIINSYKNGTDYGIHMDSDFLISHGPGLTWMDVKFDDYYPTPREKKAVEIQGLWYNALQIMSKLSQISQKPDLYYDLAENLKKNFNAQFNQQYDVIDTKDLSFRPNQILLVSLDFSMINNILQKKIVEDVKENLLTIFGLRTLSPEDSRYKGNYLGYYNKDIAYHNGTVWPWLMGPFIKAYLKVNDYEQSKREYAYRNFLKPLLDIFGDKWDGSIPEIFDGDAPYAPRGCITQAWSVAEILRVWVEDIEKISPKYADMFASSEIRV